ncbi:MAG TPA: multicopper oxidase domain-containing protein, partial [Polyangiales bacterium]
ERHLYTNRQEATALWYHDHTMGMTRINCYAGLAGVYLLRDRWDTGLPDNPLGLPAGDHELPLVLMERAFNDDGTLQIRGFKLVPQGSWEGGYVGDIGVVNGVVWPEIRVDRGMYRLRIFNGGSNSVWNLYFSNAMTFWVLGNDGGLLDAPVAVRSLRIAPGERADLLVPFGDLAAGDTVTLNNDEPVPGQSAVIGSVPMTLFCRFRANSALGSRGTVPRTLRGGTNQPPRLPTLGPPRRIRDVTIGQFTDLSRFPPAIMALNNLPFDTEDMERPLQGTVERWNLVNITDDPHPIHIHLVTFQVLGRQALDTNSYLMANPRPEYGSYWAPPADRFLRGSFIPRGEHEAGPKDTVIADAHSVTSILVRWPTADELGFDPDATHMPRHDRGGHGSHPIQGYVWHCHLFDHEDHDMMQPFRLLSDPDAPAHPHDETPIHDAGASEHSEFDAAVHPHDAAADASAAHDETDHPSGHTAFDAGPHPIDHEHDHEPPSEEASSAGCAVRASQRDNGLALTAAALAAAALSRATK